MARKQSTRRDIIVIGASAGGVEALTRLVATFPPDLPAAVFVVLHVSPSGSALPAILQRSGALPVAHAEDDEPVQEGRIYVAPPGRHMLLEPNRVRVTAGPRQNGHRPAIDPLFRTAAWAYGPRVAGVVLSGVLDDGTLGCRSIAARGGITLVQSPEEATYDSMPISAIEYDSPTYVSSVRELGATLVELAHGVGDNGHATSTTTLDPPPEEALEGDRERKVDGDVSPFSCPECNGVLWQIEDGGLLRFRCRVGHSYSMGAMDVAQGTSVEAALWTALRALEERVALKRRLAVRVASSRVRERFEHDAAVAEEHAATLRRLLEDVTSPTAADEPIVGGVE